MHSAVLILRLHDVTLTVEMVVMNVREDKVEAVCVSFRPFASFASSASSPCRSLMSRDTTYVNITSVVEVPRVDNSN